MLMGGVSDEGCEMVHGMEGTKARSSPGDSLNRSSSRISEYFVLSVVSGRGGMRWDWWECVEKDD